MSIFSLGDTIGDLKRFRDIVTIISENGFAYVIDKTELKWAVPFQYRVRAFFKAHLGMVDTSRQDTLPVRLRKLFIRLGPTFVKLGQVLSVRSDLLPPEFTAELSKLTDEVPPFSYQEAKKIIEAEFKQPVNKLFKQFDEKPLAAASLAQVHKAVLNSGEKVAIKVQRPGIRSVVEKDIHIMFYLAKIIEERVPEFRVYRPVAIVREFADSIMRELDFTAEAAHAKRFERMFAGDPTVKVAHMFSDYSTKNVLTMELIRGVKVDDVTKLTEKGIDPKILAVNGANAFLCQVFLEGFFHADPHPGNYFAMPNNIFAFIDYGMVGRLSTYDRRELASLFISFVNHDSESVIEHIKHLVEIPVSANIEAFEHDVDDILDQWYDAKLREISLAEAFFKIIDSGRKNRIYFPAKFVFLGKTLFTIEAMGQRLDPDFDFSKQLEPFIKKILQAELNPLRIKTQIEDKALDYVSYLETLPQMTIRLLEKIDSGEIGVKINSEEMREIEIKMNNDNYKQLVIFGLIFLLIFLLWVLKR